jgi:hypothetical protein
MKKLFITLAIGVMCHSVVAQNKSVRYCEIVSFESGFKGKIHISFSQGEVDSLFSFTDSTIKNSLIKVSRLKTISDLLNYMASLGWDLITVTAIGTNNIKTFYFRKDFEPSEISK